MEGNTHDELWDELREKLPFEQNEVQTAKRLKFWAAMDVNSNGYLSCA